MLPPINALELAIFLHSSLKNREIVGRSILGDLPLNLDFQEYVSALENFSLLISEDAASRALEFKLPHTGNDLFYLSINELLATTTRRITPPSRFYIAELEYLHEQTVVTPPLIIQAYFNASVLFNLLYGVADHYNSSDSTLVFWEKGKVILTSEYSNLELGSPIDVSELKSEFFKSLTHSKQKHTIIRTALLEEFGSKNVVRLGELLKQFNSFFERVVSNYQLYVSEFSFEKIKAEVEKEKLEFTTKLNKIFSDIQSQLLAIPVAVLLVGGQMENSQDWTLKNSLIWAGAFFFCILMNLLIRNQRNTLNAIHHEMDQQWQEIRGRHSSVADRFRASYQQLEIRHLHQERLIRVISGMVSFALAVASSLYIYYSVPTEVSYFAALIAASVFLPGSIYMLIRWWRALPKIDSVSL